MREVVVVALTGEKPLRLSHFPCAGEAFKVRISGMVFTPSGLWLWVWVWLWLWLWANFTVNQVVAVTDMSIVGPQRTVRDVVVRALTQEFLLRLMQLRVRGMALEIGVTCVISTPLQSFNRCISRGVVRQGGQIPFRPDHQAALFPDIDTTGTQRLVTSIIRGTIATLDVVVNRVAGPAGAFRQ